MKLTLVAENGIQILTGQGEIGPHDVQILRAGITQLLKTGKNQIVLELPEASRLPKEILQELTQLDVLSRELAGRVVLSGISPELKTQIHAFAKPPVIMTFASKAEALQFFAKPQAVDQLALTPAQVHAATPAAAPMPTPAAAAAPSPAPTPAPAAAPASADEGKQFKADIRQKELNEVGSLRKKITDLENENQLLQTQLLEKLNSRKLTHGDGAVQQKITALEQQIAQLLEQIAGGGKPGDAKTKNS